ncbi:MAG: NAD-dependent epimerase/dehydratase family protein [Acidimicrobiia bacterium]
MPLSDRDSPDRAAVVTGASGWLGRNLVRALAAQGREVRALCAARDEVPLLEVVGPTIRGFVGDVRDPTGTEDLFAGTSGATVFHVAAVIHPPAVRDFFDVNVGGTELVLDAARRAGSARFVHVSSNSPFGANAHPTDRFTEDSPFNPYMGYGASKLEAEELVRRGHARGDVDAVIVRAPWFYGPLQPPRQSQWFRAVRRGRFPMVGDGTQQRSMVFTDHLVQGLLRAEATPAASGRAYWIADAQPYELRTILATVRDALAAEGLPVSGGQPRIPRIAGVIAEKADGFLQDRGKYVQALHVLGELKDTIACDISRARAELGYDPQTSLLDGMRASIRSCLDHGEIL